MIDIKSITRDQFYATYEFLLDVYEIIRVVNPINKEIYLKIGDDSKTKLVHNCYDVWNTGKACENCVSTRAILKKEVVSKIENDGDKVYMVITTPVIFEGELCAIELVKDISTSGIVENIEKMSKVELQKMISRMNENVIKDQLTKIYNRTYLDERMKYVFDTNLSFGMIMCDIDHFKNVNDTYGHLAGDRVLYEFAQILDSVLTEEDDFVARYGGEEFVACCFNKDKESIYLIAEEMRKKVMEKAISYEDKNIAITASFGISMKNSEKSLNEVIKKADEKLYNAKENGRNQTVK